jgi:hypothetical protein
MFFCYSYSYSKSAFLACLARESIKKAALTTLIEYPSIYETRKSIKRNLPLPCGGCRKSSGRGTTARCCLASAAKVPVCRRTPGRGLWLGRGAIEGRGKFQNNPKIFFLFSVCSKPVASVPSLNATPLSPQSGAREISYRGHTWTAFNDDNEADKRILLRARYYDRVSSPSC